MSIQETESQNNDTITDLRRDALYAPFRLVLDRAETSFSQDPKIWWRRSYRLLREVQISALNNPGIYPEPMSNFVLHYTDGLIMNLAKETKLIPPKTNNPKDLDD